MNTKHRVGAVAVVACLLAASALACSMPSAVTQTPGITEIFPLPDTAVPTTEAPVDSTPAGSSGDAVFTLDQLKNMAYQMEIVPGSTVTLVDGKFSVYNPDFQANTNVELHEPVIYGDLNGDGAPDALVVLRLHTEATTGHFFYLAPVLNQNGVAQQMGFKWIGDRVIINSITIDNTTITADMVVAGPNEGACCPNTPAVRTFRLEGSTLVEYVGSATVTPFVPPLDYETFKNLTYHDVQQPGETFTLVNGTFTGDIGLGQETITLGNWIVPGDLTGDGIMDSVTVLSADPEGTGVFYYLIAIHNNYGVAEHHATAYLGDRVIIDFIQINEGIISVDMKIAGPNDGACCPNTPVTQKYKLDGVQLVLVP